MFDTIDSTAWRLAARRTLTALVLSGSFIITPNIAQAAPGALLNRIVSPFIAEGWGVTVDPSNRTVIAGNTLDQGDTSWIVTRYTAGDQLDTTFGDNGSAVLKLGTQNMAFDVAIDSQGRIVVAGSTNFGAGDTDFLVARFLDNGQLDQSFNGKGWQVIGFGHDEIAFALCLDSDDSIFVAGESFQPGFLGLFENNDDFALTHLRPDGQIDTSFGDDGRVLSGFGHNDWAQAITFDRLHRLVVVGASWEGGDDFANIVMARYFTNGNLDQSFGGGKITTSFGAHYNWAYGVAIDDLNRIVVGGVASPGHAEFTNHDFFSPYHNGNFALARYNVNGTRDESFGDLGIVQTDITGGFDEVAKAVGIDRNGRILLAGWTRTETDQHHFAVARYDAIGALDQHFGTGGVSTADFIVEGQELTDNVAQAMAFDSQGQIVLTGVSGGPHLHLSFARFDTDHPDYSLSTATAITAPIGESTPTAVTVSSIESFAGDVSLTLSGGPNGEALPPGLKVSFNGVNGDTTHLQVAANGTASTTMAITVTPIVPPQQFTLFLRPAPDPAQTHSLAIAVTVVARAVDVVPLVDLFRAAGAIDNDTIATSLKSALSAAQTAADAGDITKATQQLTAFLFLVETQRGKHIATSATINGVSCNPVTILLSDGRNAVGGLQAGSPQNPIVGFVTSPVGQASSGATVTLFDGSNQPVASATSDVSGLYRIAETSGLTPGATYTAKVTTFPALFKSATPAIQTITWQSAGVSLAPFVLQLAAPKP